MDDTTQTTPSETPPIQLVLWGVLCAVALSVVGFGFWATLAVEPPPELRVYGTVPDFTLIDRNGEPFGRDDLLGQPWVADFIFTRCVAICPRMTRQMSRVATALGPDTPVELVSISVDPEYDTPEVLEAWAQQYDAGDNWHFLTGDTEPIYSLTREGFMLPLDANPPAGLVTTTDPIVHSTRFALVDQRGQIRGYYHAFEEEALEQLLKDITRLLTE